MQASYETRETFSNGKTISHRELQTRLGFGPTTGTGRKAKEWIAENGLPYTPVGKTWFVDTADVREALRRNAKTRDEHAADQAKAGSTKRANWPSRKTEGR